MTTLRPVGFIGLGIMGFPMARHLVKAGYPLTVFNRTKEKAEAAKSFGAKVATTPREAAEGKRYLITMLTNPEAIRSIMDGPQAILAANAPDLTWIQMSTVDIDSTHEFAQEAKRKGWKYIDCPVTGSKKQVEAAEIILEAGSEPEVLEQARPLLTCMGKTLVHAGPIGAGTTLKLCMNLIVAQMTTALAESVALAEAAQLDPARIFDVLRQSTALDCGYFRMKEEALLKKDFQPAFSLANLLKDVRFILKEAAKRQQPLPVTEGVVHLLEEASREGLGNQDVSAVYLALSHLKELLRN
jgi:3-hydroxyisobutyrate dehydrogenase/glyoxylate/succinic semialdehyde reductase